ncbi:hypothetical protein HBI79_057550 [Parastagonospora nodorum]|nr:hypothetical protein HBI79_057550 [Parastagonospora nodorum]
MAEGWKHELDEPKTVETATFLEPKTSARSKRFQGWRAGVLTCTLSTCLVFLINICLSLGVLGRLGWGRDGQPILHEGQCAKVSKLSTVLHIFINAMSMTLLSASSYCMQCLSAPTRRELDSAHERQSWLDIGVLSPRNIKSVTRSRQVRWLILGLSTIPLHLFYNSVVFSSTGANSYHPILIKDSILKLSPSAELYRSGTSPSSLIQWEYASLNPDLRSLQTGALTWLRELNRLRKLHADGQLTKLENYDCLATYAVQYQVKGSVLLVTKNSTLEDDFSSGVGGPWTRQNWVCKEHSCDRYNTSAATREMWQHPETWRIADIDVSYCLAEVLLEKCRLQLSLPLAFVVVFLNAIKAICMVTMLFGGKKKMDHSLIMNIGDTVASFLDRSEAITKNMCLASSDDLRRANNMSWQWDTRHKEFTGTHRRRHISASKTRWVLTCFLYMLMLIAAIFLLNKGFKSANPNASVSPLTIMKSIGWSAPDVRTMIYGPTKDLIANAIIANSPQLILSWVYFSYNGLLTLLAMAREWESYMLHRKGLRVSDAPQGKQRSTYFLQLPYRLAIPFMFVSGFLHWIVSQSFFLVSVQTYSYDADDPVGWKLQLDHPATRVSIGYSLFPMVVGVVFGGVLLVAIIAAGCARFKTGMPVVGSCSAAISAACQPLGEDDGDAAVAAIQWGEMGRCRNGIRHCGFSREEVREPLIGEWYR